MKRRTHSQITRDLGCAKNNLAMARGEYKYFQKACANFPALIERLTKQVQALENEERQFEAASSREQRNWKFAGEISEPVRVMGSLEVVRIAVEGK